MQILDLKGKSLADKSQLMAEHWRSLSEEDKAKYRSSMGSDNEDSDAELSLTDKKRVAVRVAKRHQSDVSYLVIILYSSDMIFFYDN